MLGFWLELNLRCLIVLSALGSGNLKHGFGVETEHAGEDIAGEGLAGVVELLGGRVEETAGGSELVLDVGNLVLKLEEILVGLEIGICFEAHAKTGKRAGELILGSNLIIDAGGIHGSGTGTGDRLEKFLLVLGITLDSSNELGDEIMALLELHIDVGKSILTVVAETHKIVVKTDAPEDEHDGNDDDDDKRC